MLEEETMRTGSCGRAAACLTALWLSTSLGAATPPAQAPSRVPVDCDRACLERLVDAYLSAVVAHDPTRLPLSADVIYTENDQQMEVGDGFWNTAAGRGNYSHYFADLVTAQAGWMGTMREERGLLLMALRLRVQLGRITEIETSYFRAGGGGPNDIAATDARGTPEALWLEPIPPAERSSRNQLIEIANAYFEGMERNDGKGLYPFTDDCHRIENGAPTTNVAGSAPISPGGFNYMGSGCAAQFESGYLGIVTRIHARRYPLVDEERGIVWATSIFDMNGTVRSIRLTTGETADMRMFAGRASSIEVTEAFRIEKNRIRRVEMIGSSVPYHLNSAWPGGLSGK
jgi:hypothetical protein